jgi:hypothetical protein
LRKTKDSDIHWSEHANSFLDFEGLNYKKKREEEGDERRHHYAVTCQFLQKLRAHLPQRSGLRFQLRLDSPGIDLPMTIDNLKAREPRRDFLFDLLLTTGGDLLWPRRVLR